ncbi:hypothetical protein Dda_8215 [Drechslerella dactyloides]|uniref:Plus3 domain-containing protein n=1 Tax=Drechslerella dactyloides TaxID=74499 RepID=A0AAD6IV22_DREDA|nr:hypothetical protein Dda_8215 [Drechslerella dactyloides]
MSDDFDDLDNELLGLGDGDEGDDQHHHSEDGDKHSPPGDESEGAVSDSTVSSQQRRKKPTTTITSPSPPPARRAADISEDESDTALDGRKGPASTRKRPSPGDDASSPPKKRAKAAKKTKRKRRGDDDASEDDGGTLLKASKMTKRRLYRRRLPSDYSDDMDVSAGSDDDAVVSEPISSDEDMEDEEDDDIGPLLYPYQQFYKNASDKSWVDSLPELDREQIIAERSEEVSKHEEARLMRARAREQKRNAEKQKKKDAKALLASATRRSMRGESSAKRNADSKKSTQLSELVKKRSEKNARKAGGAGDADSSKRRRRESPSRSEGEEDESSDEQPAWASQEKSSALKKGTEEAGLDDIKLLIVGRSTIAKYWAHPGFEEATIGCFARVCIGNHPDTNKPTYRLCIIKGWQDSRHIYEISASDRTIKFRRNAIIASAEAERPTRVDVFSDSAPTEDEFRWWSAAMDVAKMKRPTVAFVEKKRQETKSVTQRKLTNADFDQIQLKKTSYHPDDPTLPFLDIPGLRRHRQQLVEQGNEAEILKIDRELEWRAPPKALTAAMGKPSQLDILGQINKRNREINRHDIRKAQLEEKKKNEMAARHAAEHGDNSFMDPFARVKTHARIYHDDVSMKKNGKKADEPDIDDLFGGADEAKEGEATGAGLGKTDSKVPQVKARKPQGIDAVIASLDLQFDIDFS